MRVHTGNVIPWIAFFSIKPSFRSCIVRGTSSLQTKRDDECLAWLSLGSLQVREPLCPLLSVARASGAKHYAAAPFEGEPSWHLSKFWEAMPAFLSSWAGRESWGKAACLELTAKVVSCWKVVITTWKKKDPKLQCKSLTFSAILGWKHEAILGDFLFEGNAWDGPKADIKRETYLLGHFSSVMHLWWPE